MLLISRFMKKAHLNTKLLLTMGTGFFITLLIGVQSFLSLQTVSQNMVHLYEKDLLGIFYIQEAEVHLAMMGRSLRQMALTTSPSERASAEKILREAEKKVKADIIEVRQRSSRIESKKKLADFETAFSTYLTHVHHVISLLNQGDFNSREQATQVISAPEFSQSAESADRALDSIVEIKRASAQHSSESSLEMTESKKIASMVVLFLGLGGSMIFGLFISRSIRRPLEDLQNSIQHLAKGDLSHPIPHLDYQNEIGSMAQAVLVLQEAAQARELEHQVKEKLAHLDHLMQNASTFETFADAICSECAPQFNLVYGAFYLKMPSRCLVRVGGYGYDDSLHTQLFEWGQGLIGQAARDQQPIRLNITEDKHVGVKTGLGVLKVSAIEILPICLNNQTVAVLEFASLTPLSAEHHTLLSAYLPLIAVKLQLLAGHVETRELLEKTQEQTLALAASQQQLLVRRDELEESNTQMAEQTRLLEEQADELEAQQSALLAQQEELESSRARLMETEERTRLILSSVNEGIIGLDATGKISFVNPAVIQLLGYEENELLGQSMHPLVHYADSTGAPYPQEHCPMYLTAQDGQSRKIDHEVLWKKDGTAFSVEYDTTPLYKDNTLVGTVIVFRDISERKAKEKRLAESEERLDLALKSANLGLWDWCAETGEVISNPIWAEMLGYLPEQLGAQYGACLERFFNLIHPEDMEDMKAQLEAHIKGLSDDFEAEYRMKTASGEWKWILNIAKAMDRDEHGMAQRMVGIHMDVDARKKADEAVREAKEAAEEATRMKSDFLANMSHEIRTPMNAIIGMSHLALQTDLTAKQRNYIGKVESAAKNLLGIINDILDFSKIEAGKMKFEAQPFSLEDVLAHLADLSVIKAQEKGLELLFDFLPSLPMNLIGDPLRLGQVLVNLVNNAIKFTEQGEVTVRVKEAQRTSDSITFQFDIVDTGIGLSPEQQKKLFSAFSQADASTTRKYGGTGLGLTISKRLVEMMGGDIGVHSATGMGSTFFFTATFGLQTEQRSLLSAVPLAETQGLRILIVDDNASSREILQTILHSLKFEADTVSSGKEAIARLKAAETDGRPYGLVLMDWMMPEMDGIDTIRHIRGLDAVAHTPAFVMVTAYSREELLQKADTLRIDGILVKPISPSTLLDSILNALGKEVAQPTRKNEKAAHYQEAARRLKGLSVLLVEDNIMNQELALALLEEVGVQVELAENGQEAVEKINARTHAYDLVLMDCQMPVMDGFEATEHIRALADHADLPILAMTANAMAGDKEKCLAVGMNDHIPKPIDVEQLFLTMAKWVKPTLPPLEATPPAPTLNLKEALKRVGGNETLLNKLLNRFRETQSTLLKQLEEAIENNEVETAIREAHTLKGLAGNIGAEALFQAAATVEKQLKQGELTDLAHSLNTLEHTADTVEKALNTHLSSVSPPLQTNAPLTEAAASFTPSPEEKTAFTVALRQLMALLEDSDSEAENQIETLKPTFEQYGADLTFKRLYQSITTFEYDEAITLLTTYLAQWDTPS